MNFPFDDRRIFQGWLHRKLQESGLDGRDVAKKWTYSGSVQWTEHALGGGAWSRVARYSYFCRNRNVTSIANNRSEDALRIIGWCRVEVRNAAANCRFNERRR